MLNPSTAERLALPGLASATAPMQAAAEYWKTTLSDAPGLLELPTDHARPARQDYVGARVGVELDEELSAGLEALSRRHGATLSMTLLAGWAVVLSRLSGQADVVVGTPAAGRGRRETEGPIGFAADTLPIRVDLSGAPTVAELLERVKERVLGAQRHQDLPFEQVVELVRPARSLAHHPLFQATFAWRNTPGRDGPSLPAVEAGGGRAGDAEGAGPSSQVKAEFALSLALGEREGRIAGSVTYATALFERTTVERWVGYLRRALEEMVADESRAADRLELLGEAERARLLALGEGAAPGLPHATVDALFAQGAAAAPEAVALAWDGGRMTYAELDDRANRLARHLRRAGVAAGTRVGVCLERGPEMVVATLAALKAGGAYVPLDPAYPAERLAFMLADTAVPVLVTESPLADRLPPHAARIVRVDADAGRIAAEPAEAPAIAADPEAAAYVMYTSGSTGRPKGVEVPHRAIVRLVRGQDYLSIDPSDVFLQLAPASFDAATLELWGPLLNGARLAIHPAGQPSVESIGRALAEHGVTVLWLTAGLFHLVVEERIEILRGVRQLVAGGDVLSVSHVRRVLAELPQTALINGYGPTENTTFTCCHRIAEAPREGASIPVGRPIANTYVRVLDAGMQPAPAGVPGELYAGGAGLALGYLNQPELTAEKFVADPYLPGARLYRTGDRVRWRADGTVEFLGRVDTQVKIRGFRVEPGEVEAVLRAWPGVREAAVVVREDHPGDRRLVAYVAGEVAVDEVREHLRGRLPEHMLPGAIVRLDGLPLTANGKVDRKALPAPELAPAEDRYVAPRTPVEEVLAGIWAEVLRLERVGVEANFFEAGGHSLLATQVVSRIRELFAVELPLRALFEGPTVAELAARVEEMRRAGVPVLPPVVPVERTGALPLSFTQQRLWFLEQLGSPGSVYHLHKTLRLRGELDVDALVRALDGIVARHEALRTTFPQVDGVPGQRIAPAAASGFHLVEHDLGGRADAEAELGRLIAAEAHAPFDLERGPLVRGRLVRLAADDHVLLLAMHHLVSDGWSLGVLFDELSALYAAHRDGRAAHLPGLPVQYADYAVWQRRWVEGDVLREQAEYWTRTLAGAPELLELPTDRPRPAQVDHAGALLGVELDEALTAGLKALARRHETTLYMTLVAGWAVVLGRLSGQDDGVIGTPTAGRGRREVEGLIGCFVNTLALRLELAGAPTVAELLGRVKERALAAQHHQDIPFEQVVELVDPARSLSLLPLFQVVIAWQNLARGDGSTLWLPGLEAGVAVESAHVDAKTDLWLGLWEADGRILGNVKYATALFERATVERHLAYLRRVLEAFVADDLQGVDALPLLPEAERRLVLEEWNRTADEYPAGQCLHELFERQVERAPGATAVVFGDETLSYAELNARANRLAHDLRSRGVGPEVRVALCVERGPGMVAAVLAVLKAGGAYVPLDPAYPRDRLAYMLADSAPAVVLTQGAVAQALAGVLGGLGGGVPVLELDAAAPAWASQRETNPARGGLAPEHPAYVIYTSGSTGRPKGVLVPHRGLCNVAAAQQRAFGVGPDDRVLQFASLSFDAAAFELVMALASGAALCVAPRDELLPGPGLLALLRAHAVTTVTLPPSALAALPAEELPALRTITVAGEALPAELVERWGARHRLWNLYGPTEATIWSTAAECADPARKPDIGVPIANVRACVLDAALAPLPVGVPGELYVGGAGVARGYLGRPGLTAERFVPDPFSGVPGARLYRTGDRVRWRTGMTSGVLEYLGRLDFQVKVRGYRIEPGEIEARLAEHPAVREAVVLAREDEPGEKRLVAYVVGDQTAGAEVLRAHLGETLPEYMVPAAYVHLDALPLTPNGKLDRKALPSPEGEAFVRHGY
ncbi:MAG: amino acid adenylation domain-containing protein, partial [Longimicrobiaceae bacterium]